MQHDWKQPSFCTACLHSHCNLLIFSIIFTDLIFLQIISVDKTQGLAVDGTTQITVKVGKGGGVVCEWSYFIHLHVCMRKGSGSQGSGTLGTKPWGYTHR